MPHSAPHRDRALAANTIQVLLAEALVLPTGVVTAAVLTRGLGPEGYGLLVLTAAVIGWVEWTVVALLARAAITFIGAAEDWRPIGATVVRLHVVVGLAAAALLWLGAESVATLFHEPRLAGYVRLFALNVPVFVLAQAHRHILVGIGSFRARAVVAAGRWVARLVLIVVLVTVSPSVSAAILGSIGASIVEVMIARVYARPPLFGRWQVPVGPLLRFAVPLALAAVGLRIFDKLDLVILKILGATAADAGVYGAAQTLTVVPGLFAISFAPLLLATLVTTLRGGDMPRAVETGREAVRAVFWLLPFFAMGAGAASELLGWVFGRAYLAAAPLFAVLLFGGLALFLIAVATAILTAAGKPQWTFVLSAALLPTALVGHVLCIPRWGAAGAASVTTASAILGAATALAAIHRVWGIAPPFATLWRCALLGVIAYGVAVLVPTPGGWVLLKLTVLGGAILASLVMCGEIRADVLAGLGLDLGWRGVRAPRESRP